MFTSSFKRIRPRRTYYRLLRCSGGLNSRVTHGTQYHISFRWLMIPNSLSKQHILINLLPHFYLYLLQYYSIHTWIPFQTVTVWFSHFHILNRFWMKDTMDRLLQIQFPVFQIYTGFVCQIRRTPVVEYSWINACFLTFYLRSGFP